MTDYEKLGVFYLGKEHDLGKGKRLEEAVLYKSKDLTTHAVIIGMTGSGKTGLAMGILEEALIDKIPIIAIDPKGDIPNLMLTFPELRASDFRPWIDEQEAARKGQTPDQYAGAQAGLWRKGIGSWDQGPDRIRRLKEAAEVTIYTPGSHAGKPINVLRQFSPPAQAIRNDRDLLRERILNTVNGLLSLLEIDADPITSPEHILLANILERAWAEGTSMDLAGLIQAIQNPPFQRVGVLDLDLFFPPQKRLALAMRINNLLASPGFEAWMAGDPLEIPHLLHTAEGKPRASIFSIAHLNDSERMFFVALLLNEVVGWMRTQSGTGSLRALLYMDEIFGFFPPVKNPPAKAPLLTLLKQARAVGLGVVLATQNPVDLDYKGLSNTGTWFIGRLQTERDKQRVQAGLEGAAPASGMTEKKTADLLSQLGKRVFLLHNVHEAQPRLFQTRWVLSYLRGPVTRNQIKKLMSDQKVELKPVQADPAPVPTAVRPERQMRPPDPRGVEVFFAAPSGTGHGVFYRPTALGKLDVHFSNARYGVDETQTSTLATTLESGPIPLDWDRSFELQLDLQNLDSRPVSDAAFDALPQKVLKGTPFKKWQKDLLRWVCQNRPITLWRHKEFKMTSRPGESERQFLARLAHKAREDRDLATEQLQKKFLSRFEKLERKYQKAQHVLDRESAQVRSGELDTVMSMGTAVLGAFLGGRRRSSSRLRSAARSASRMRKDKMDVVRAQAVADSVRHELDALEREFDEALAEVQYTPDPGRETLEPILIKPKSTQMTVELFALVWLPYREDVDGTLSPDW